MFLYNLECYDPLNIAENCQVTASSQLNEDSPPHNVLYEGEGMLSIFAHTLFARELTSYLLTLV